MNYQEFMVESTQAAMEEAFRYAKAVPPEKQDWKPLEAGRSVLDICRELAMTPTWAVDTIDFKETAWSDEEQAKAKELMAGWTTIEACEQECLRRLESLFALYRSISDDRLKETRWLPYDGGRDFTVKEMMGYPKWNFVYHLGQISYIQTLFGDKGEH